MARFDQVWRQVRISDIIPSIPVCVSHATPVTPSTGPPFDEPRIVALAQLRGFLSPVLGLGSSAAKVSVKRGRKVRLVRENTSDIKGLAKVIPDHRIPDPKASFNSQNNIDAPVGLCVPALPSFLLPSLVSQTDPRNLESIAESLQCPCA